MELQKTSQIILLQLVRLLESLSDNQYRKSLDVVSDVSIGVQVQHIIKLYTNLLEGMSKGEINYAGRLSDCVAEIDRSKGIERLRTIIHQLDKWPQHAGIKINSDIGCLENHQVSTASTYGRELLFCLENSIHHMILIKTGVYIKWPDVALPMNFGMISESYFN
jgi:hypothetical protein